MNGFESLCFHTACSDDGDLLIPGNPLTADRRCASQLTSRPPGFPGYR